MAYESLGIMDGYEIRVWPFEFESSDEDSVMVEVEMIGDDKIIKFSISIAFYDVDEYDLEDLSLAEFVEKYKNDITVGITYYVQGTDDVVTDKILDNITLKPYVTQRFLIIEDSLSSYFGLDQNHNNNMMFYVEHEGIKYFFQTARGLLSFRTQHHMELLYIYKRLSNLDNSPYTYVYDCLNIDINSANAIFGGIMKYMTLCHNRTGMTLPQFSAIIEHFRHQNLPDFISRPIEVICTQTVLNPLIRDQTQEPYWFDYIDNTE